jgi:hypothetical protein
MSAEIVVRGSVRSAEELAEFVGKWISITDAFELGKFRAFLTPIVETLNQKLAADDSIEVDEEEVKTETDEQKEA